MDYFRKLKTKTKHHFFYITFQFEKKIKKIRNKVKGYTGGYEIGYVDFDKNGKAIAKTNQSSFLQGEGEIGARTTGIKNFFKNTKYHNNLYKNFIKII